MYVFVFAHVAQTLLWMVFFVGVDRNAIQSKSEARPDGYRGGKIFKMCYYLCVMVVTPFRIPRFGV